VSGFYEELKSLIDDLKMHQPAVTDATTLRRHRQDLAVSNFLSGLSLSLCSQMRGQVLGEDNIPALTATFSRVMRVPTPIQQSVLVSERGRGCGRDRGRNFGG